MKGGDTMILQRIKKQGVLTAIMAGALLAGVEGLALFNVSQSQAQTVPAVTTAPTTPSMTSKTTNNTLPTNDGQSGRKFTPNEDPAHEAQESAQREAQENAGQFPTVK